MQVQSRDLPNYEMPAFNGIGANEYIVDVTHDVVDFISAADTPFVYELNIWYLEVGTNGSELRLERPGAVRASVQAASLLSERAVAAGPPTANRQQPQWSPEHSRVAGSRDVTVEAIINGRPVAAQRLTADGVLRDLAFDIPIERSSWIAIRILGSAHTNPIFVRVGERPIRASRRSAEWCLKGVDQRWSQKSTRISPPERPAAQRAYDHARDRYRQIVSESEAD